MIPSPVASVTRTHEREIATCSAYRSMYGWRRCRSTRVAPPLDEKGDPAKGGVAEGTTRGLGFEVTAMTDTGQESKGTSNDCRDYMDAPAHANRGLSEN